MHPLFLLFAEAPRVHNLTPPFLKNSALHFFTCSFLSIRLPPFLLPPPPSRHVNPAPSGLAHVKSSVSRPRLTCCSWWSDGGIPLCPWLSLSILLLTLPSVTMSFCCRVEKINGMWAFLMVACIASATRLLHTWLYTFRHMFVLGFRRKWIEWAMGWGGYWHTQAGDVCRHLSLFPSASRHDRQGGWEASVGLPGPEWEWTEWQMAPSCLGHHDETRRGYESSSGQRGIAEMGRKRSPVTVWKPNRHSSPVCLSASLNSICHWLSGVAESANKHL